MLNHPLVRPLALAASLLALVAAGCGGLPDDVAMTAATLQAQVTPCDTAQLQRSLEECQRTCTSRVYTTYGFTYTPSCQAQTNCNYVCVAVESSTGGGKAQQSGPGQPF